MLWCQLSSFPKGNIHKNTIKSYNKIKEAEVKLINNKRYNVHSELPNSFLQALEL